jgi:class 3 adenylate cyclase/quercetin dioxygenase-like cupin family protein
MSGRRTGNFDTPDEVRPNKLGVTEVVNVGDLVVGRQTFQPGWRWKTHVAPVAGTPLCAYRHVGYTISGRNIAELEDGSQIEIRPGDVFDIPANHDSWVVGDDPWVALIWTGIRTYAGEIAATGERVVTTILFTDIVDSTRVAGRLGDAQWRTVLGEQREQVRTALDRHRGRELDTAGDGFLAHFDGAARAVRCAEEVCRSARELDLDVRAGIHTGEVEVVGSGLRGMAVHVAARIMALAGPGEILVSGTTRELLDGSGIALEDRGQHELKGVEGARAVFAVAASD